ncbi:MAG: NTP transferase domain-containing protein [Acidimicrobiales bacterium]
MPDRSLTALVLAAGAGVRMRSTRPKPLHLLCGRAMLLYVLDAVGALAPDRVIVVVGHGAERVTKKLNDEALHVPIEFVEQAVQRGSADAVGAGLAAIPSDDLDDDGDVLVVPGDTPLLSAGTVRALLARHRAGDSACTLLAAGPHHPAGPGPRVVRARAGSVARVAPLERAEREGDEEALASGEVATLVYCFRRSVLAPALRRLQPDHPLGEKQLSDVVAVLHQAGYRVDAHLVDDAAELASVHDRVQLAAAEAELRRRINRGWLEAGVTMVDPERTYIDATVRLGGDVTLFPNTILQGRTFVGDGAVIGPDARLVDCMVGAGARVDKSVGVDAEIGPSAVIGPFAVLEPGAQAPAGGRVAPFTVERCSDLDRG